MNKKRFAIFIATILMIIIGVVYGGYHYVQTKKHQKSAMTQVKTVIPVPVAADNSVENDAPAEDNKAQADNANVDVKTDNQPAATEYKNNTYNYSLRFPENWYMNNDDSESKFAKEKQDDGSVLLSGGQTFLSNYDNINKYTPQNKPADFRLLGLTIYKDSSASIDDFAKKIGASDGATKDDFQTQSNLKGAQYVSSGTDKNPSITIIFKRDNEFFVFSPAFLNGDTASSDIMQNIVKSFSVN